MLFRSLFLNGAAHIQHHYLFNSAAYRGSYRNPRWYLAEGVDPVLQIYRVYDAILADCLAMAPRPRLMIATGLHQDPVDEPVFYWRLRDHAAFLRSLGCGFDAVEPRMSRDFLVRCKDAAQAAAAAARLLSGRAPDGLALFEVDNRGASLFVTLGYRYALSNTWRPTDAERRLADPQILAAMDDLSKIPPETIPLPVASRMAQPVVPQVSGIALENLGRAWRAGITVVMGTDAGNIGTLHGPSVFREMELMTRAGLTPLQVLRSATANGARAMRRERKLGALAVGKLADLVILDADPLADLGNLSRIHRVVKDGQVFRPEELLHSIR